MAMDREQDFGRADAARPAEAQPARATRAPVDPFADMRHAAPRPSPYEVLESAGPPV